MTKVTGFIGCLALMWVAFPAMADNDHDEARRLQQAGDILPLETIIKKAQAIHPGRILEAELESEHGHYYYEIELLDDNGRVWEMKLDSQTGEPINKKQDD
jgi:uncharacterized membrane protein YkoI